MTLDPSALNNYREFMGDEADAFIVDIIETFLENAPRLFGQMETSMASADSQGFVRAAHTLKSNSATVGATLLASLAAELESRGKSETLTDLAEQVRLAREEFALVKSLLQP
jgi:HPt (histidine-containing phosphotransfer) domain-containing protein